MRVERYLREITQAFTADGLPEAVDRLCGLLGTCRSSGRTLLVAGNGGSAGTAEHFAQDARRKGGLRCLALTLNSSALTASANDHGFERVYVDAYDAVARDRDPVLIFTTSGNSPNLVALARHVRERAGLVLSFTGAGGGAVGRLTDHGVRVALADPGMIESCHLALAQ